MWHGVNWQLVSRKKRKRMVPLGNTLMKHGTMAVRITKVLWGSRDTYSAVLRNTHGDDTPFEASYAVFALQMLPHAVGFYKRAPWPPEAIGFILLLTFFLLRSINLSLHAFYYFYMARRVFCGL
jgi:hypothetical protein